MPVVVSHHSLLPYRTIHQPPHLLSNRRFAMQLTFICRQRIPLLAFSEVQFNRSACYHAHHRSTLTPCREAVPTPTSSRPIDSSSNAFLSSSNYFSEIKTIFRNVFQRFAPFSNVASGHSYFLIGFRSASHRGKSALYNIGFDQAIYYRKVIVIDHSFPFRSTNTSHRAWTRIRTYRTSD